MQSIPVFYTERMVADARSYSPSAGKPRAALASWRALGIPLDVREPPPLSVDDLTLAHDRAFVEGVLAGRLPNGFGNTLPEVAASLPYTSGALLAGAREAIANGRVAVAPVSGFHHAGHDFAGGFCTFNGLVVAAQALRRDGLAQRVGILDFDHHYGNGTDDIIARLRLDHIVHYTAGREYRRPSQAAEFLERIPDIVATMGGCRVILYQAGADPHVDDPLGGWLTTQQLAERDRRVFVWCCQLGVPVVWNLAGGYQTPLRKVLDIHDNTLRACAAVYLGGACRPDGGTT